MSNIDVYPIAGLPEVASGMYEGPVIGAVPQEAIDAEVAAFATQLEAVGEALGLLIGDDLEPVVDRTFIAKDGNGGDGDAGKASKPLPKRQPSTGGGGIKDAKPGPQPGDPPATPGTGKGNDPQPADGGDS